MNDFSGKDENGTPENETEHSAVEPTIVGGRPLARNRSLQGIPRGIEVLIKKASVDPEFRSVLLEKRAEAAPEIELELSATEASMLNAIPASQIEKIIDNAKVPNEYRRVFLGKAAAAMLSVLAGLGLPGCSPAGFKYQGIRPDGPYEKPPITVSGVKVPAVNEQIKVSPQDKGPDEVDVVVGYECPFDSGVITISFREDSGAAARNIDYRPTTVLMAKGKRETTFQATGRSGDTRWLQVELANSSKDSQAARLSVSSDSNKYGSGEYLVKDCLITHIMEYRKTWKA
jgi:hypothetical protein